ncbi:hypothetical protein GXW83_06800 [Streptacidiphilus sp. PB12-B1b]|uniref:hypothetical protein n=1 Tax=Streptacidiphilus sp. PB12-B1b TaxID=2705012 RepID=UPI0015FC7CDF|nr:hypothetical protein [Streptacidiphilus sp. PB12-B1b]QMU75493.1 hypothetical protein GXW83_06800 [Streptacidiphilus sp. PB12-B1b]
MTTPGESGGAGRGPAHPPAPRGAAAGGSTPAAGPVATLAQRPAPARTGARTPAPPASPARARTGARLRRAIGTPPRRLWSAGSLLALLAVVFGVLTYVQVVQRSDAATSVVEHSQPLSDDAAQIFRTLADADTTAATGFLQAGHETAAVRNQYTSDIRTASTLLAQAAASASAADPGQRQIQQLSSQLPSYTDLVGVAGADDRVGYPLGGAYLRYASGQMQTTMLAEAQTLYQVETARLHQDYGSARSLPWAALGLGLVVLLALVRAQIRLYRATNRVFNVGLVLASASVVLALVWLAAAQSLAASALGQSDARGSAPLQVLNEAQIKALQCRGAENLNLVARGSTDIYETSWSTVSAQLAGPTGYLHTAAAMTSADGSVQQEVGAAQADFATWQQRHDTALRANDNGDYDTAVADTIGTPGGASAQTTDAAFTRLDASLNAAIAHERTNFDHLASQGRGDTSGLAAGALALTVLAAFAALWGVSRRTAEYR